MSSVFVSPVDLAAVNALSADSLIAHLGIEFTAAGEGRRGEIGKGCDE